MGGVKVLVNKINVFFIIIGIVYSFVTGNTSLVNDEILNVGNSAISIVFNLLSVMCLWQGLMSIAKASGLLNVVAKYFSYVLKYIFPEIPKDHEAMGLISLNIIMNMLGLSNAATPIGLSAVKSLKELNKNRDTVSRSMCTFLVINASGLTLIPTTIIALRLSLGSESASSILLPCFISNVLSTLMGLIIDRVCYLFRRGYEY